MCCAFDIAICGYQCVYYLCSTSCQASVCPSRVYTGECYDASSSEYHNEDSGTNSSQACEYCAEGYDADVYRRYCDAACDHTRSYYTAACYDHYPRS